MESSLLHCEIWIEYNFQKLKYSHLSVSDTKTLSCPKLHLLYNMTLSSGPSMNNQTLTETYLVFKGQGLSYISRESIYDDTISIWNLHDLLLDLSYCCLLKKISKSNKLHHPMPHSVCKCPRPHYSTSCLSKLKRSLEDWG